MAGRSRRTAARSGRKSTAAVTLAALGLGAVGALVTAAPAMAAPGDPVILGCSSPVTFDSDAAGWRAGNSTTGYGFSGSPSSANWSEAGGNPGGTIAQTDISPDGTEVWTPDFTVGDYETDYSFAIGGTLEFDYRTDAALEPPAYVGIVGDNGIHYWYNFSGQVGTSTAWTHVTVPLEPSAWLSSFSPADGPGGSAPDLGPFRTALASLDHFSFSMDGAVGLGGVTYLDNVQIPCSDLGDAPDSYGTEYADDGPSHRVLGLADLDGIAPLMLGASVDFEADGQPSAAADADADDDGVSSPISIATGLASTITVSATNTSTDPATLAGWIDLDGNGTFDGSELATISIPASSGTADYALDFPGGTVTADTYARFRIFPGDVTDPQPTGCADAGEVEDYAVTVTDPPTATETATGTSTETTTTTTDETTSTPDQSTSSDTSTAASTSPSSSALPTSVGDAAPTDASDEELPATGVDASALILLAIALAALGALVWAVGIARSRRSSALH